MSFMQTSSLYGSTQCLWKYYSFLHPPTVTEQQSHAGGLAGGAIASLLGAALLIVAMVTLLCLYHKLRKRKRQLERIAEVTFD